MSVPLCILGMELFTIWSIDSELVLRCGDLFRFGEETLAGMYLHKTTPAFLVELCCEDYLIFFCGKLV